MPQKQVALLVETSNGYCRGLLEGIIAYTKSTGNWSVHLMEQERGAAPPAWLESWEGDGIIARIETDRIGRELKKSGLPIVDLSAARHISGVPWADTDDYAIARLAIDHFTERGFRHLAYCGDAGFVWSVKRSKHFRELAGRAECSFHEHHCTPRYDSTYSPIEEAEKIRAWLQELPRPIAIMGCYDFMAQQVLDGCRQLDIAVPEQIAVLGVDNDRLLCELSNPPLSSIRPNTWHTGYEAAQLLDRMMNGEKIDDQQPLITQPLGIQIRESTDTLAIDDEEIAMALGYIRRHAAENIRVADVVRQGSLSRRALEHRFQKRVGHTPSEEIQRVRINLIKSLLQNTDHSIAEIAERTGFTYAEYMTATFRRETGQTPTQYRAECLKSHRSK